MCGPFGAAAAALAVAGARAWAGDALSEDQITKAAMIYNFGRFTTWPVERFASASDPVVLCVDPASSLAAALEAISGKPVGTRILMVRQTSRIDHSCQMAFVRRQDFSDSYLSALRDRGVLTIGESPGFTDMGAIQLVTIGRQIRFAINQKNALAAGAHLSSNLLRLAVAVH